MQNLYLYIDDSGVFHRNEKSHYFVYAGFIFIGEDERDTAKRKYININNQLKKSLGANYELKSSCLSNKHKKALYTVLQGYESFSVAVDLSKVHSAILSDKKSINRFKDYALKRVIKEKIISLIQCGKVFINIDINQYR